MVVHRRCRHERRQRTEIERCACPAEQIERSILICCGVEFTGEDIMSAIEREEEGGVGKERANTFFAGTVEDRRVGTENVERDIANDAHGNRSDFYANHLMQNQENTDKCCFHRLIGIWSRSRRMGWFDERKTVIWRLGISV